MLGQFLAGSVLLVLLYSAPGVVALRRAGLDVATRFVAGTAITLPLATACFVLLGFFESLTRVTIVAVWLLLMAVAVLAPIPQGWFGDKAEALRGPLLAAGGVGLLLVIQALRPAIFRTNDAITVWAPLAADIGDRGVVDPGWLPTMVEGFPPSVGLIAGSIGRVAGSFADVHAFIVHPFFATLLLGTAVLLGGLLGGRSASWLTLIVVVSTPLLGRGLLFHDDMVAGFLTAAVVLLALRATTPSAWAVVGVVAGGALAIKHLGIVAALFVGAVLVARMPARTAWMAAAAGWLIGLPWYLWNIARFGNPVHPLLPELFGESAAVKRVVADATATMRLEDLAAFTDLGVLTIVMLAIGIVVAIFYAPPQHKRVFFTIVGAAAVFVGVWQLSGYRTRHMWQVLPVLAAIGSAALVGLAPLRDRSRRVLGLLVVYAVVLGGVTTWNLGSGYSGRAPSDASQTGLYSVMVGKWQDIRQVASPPADEMDLFVAVRHAWDALADARPDLLVFSFDNRRYYIPQHVLSAADVAALAVYAEPSAEARHQALVDLGVGFVLDNRRRGLQHPLFLESTLWEELRQRSDLYREMSRGNGVRVYEVLSGQ